MASNSRYVRLLRAAGTIQVGAQSIQQLPSDSLARALALTRAKGQLTLALNVLQDLATDCSIAKGMYASNRAIRDAITSAGLAISEKLPALATLSSALDDAAKDPTYDTAKLAEDIRMLAIQFATISFTPKPAEAPIIVDTLKEA